MLTALGRDIPSLSERVEALEMALGLDLPVPAEYGLTRREQEVFGMLQKVPVLRQDRAFLVLYGDRNDPPGEKLINVWMSKIRAKLRPFGCGDHPSMFTGLAGSSGPALMESANVVPFPDAERALPSYVIVTQTGSRAQGG